MLLVTTCIAGGMAYAGFKTLVKYMPKKRETWLVKYDAQASSGARTPIRADLTEPDEATTAHYLNVTSISLGLSISGALFYGPLGLLSVPLTVYSTLPVLEKNYDTLIKEKRLRVTMFHTAAVFGTLATNHYIVSAFIAWLHYYLTLLAFRLDRVSELIWRGLERDYQQFMAQFYGAKPQSVWLVAQGTVVEIPFNDLRVGDVILVNEGEIIPIAGKVVDGRAEVSRLIATGSTRPVSKEIGDHVSPSIMVLSGKLSIQVEQL